MVAARLEAGMTLVEVMLALVIGTLVAAGTMMAFGMAARLSGRSIGKAEAVTYVTQTLEDKRNKIACRRAAETGGDAWFLPVSILVPTDSCKPDTTGAALNPATSPIDAGSRPEPLPGGIVPSILGYSGTGRTYEVKSGPDLDGDGKPDYYIVSGTVTWNEPN